MLPNSIGFNLCLVLEEGRVHHLIVISYHLQHLLLARFYNVTTYYHLLKNKIGLVEVEDQIQFTNVSKIPVQYLHEVMDSVKYDQLIVFFFDASDEVKGGISKI